MRKRQRTFAEKVPAFPTHAVERELPVSMLADKVLGRFDDVRIESAAEALVGGNHNHLNPLAAPVLQQRMRLALGACHEAVQDGENLLGVRPRAHHAFLSATQLGRRDHFHGLRDLLGVFHRADAAANVENVGHESVTSDE